MTGRRRLAGAGLEGNPAGRSKLRKGRASPRLRAFQRRENQSGNTMFPERFIRARPAASAGPIA